MNATEIYFNHLKDLIIKSPQLEIVLKKASRSRLENMLFEDIEIMKIPLEEKDEVDKERTEKLYQETLNNVNIKELADKIEEFVKEN